MSENVDDSSDKKTESGNQKKLVLVITCTALLLDYLSNFVIIPMLHSYEQQFKENDRSNGDNSTHTDLRIGLLISSKSFFQTLFGPIIGTITDKIGYEKPLIAGCTIIAIATTTFAFTMIYPLLLAARCIQGIGTMLTATASFSLIADRYTQDAERSKAQGIALVFLSLGCTFAPTFGGLFFEYVHKTAPFLILASFAILDGILVFFLQSPKLEKSTNISTEKTQIIATPIYRLILDPYIIICTGSFFIAGLSWAFLMPTLTRWLTDTMHTDEFQSGLVWLPGFFSNVVSTYVAVQLAKHYPGYQWLVAGAGLIIGGTSCLAIPFCRNAYMVSIPLAINCFGIALVDTAIIPLLACIIDHRHARVYGSVYSLICMSYGLANTVGPIISDFLFQKIGFFWLNVILGLVNLLYVPLLLLLREFRHKDLGYDEIIDTPG